MVVIPAKAGTQWRSLHNATVATTLDSRFRGNDSAQYRRHRGSGDDELLLG